MYCDTFMQSTYSVANLKLPILELFSVSIARLFTKYLTLGLCYNYLGKLVIGKWFTIDSLFTMLEAGKASLCYFF